jgi:hypothetical protein
MLKSLSGTVLVLAGLVSSASAATIEFEIENLSNSSDPTSAVFADQGYVGMYSSAYAGIFATEVNFSTTLLQVDVSSLAGFDITSAQLSFSYTNGSSGPGGIDVTRVSTGGILSHQFAPGLPLETLNASVTGGTSNSVDVTNLLQAAIDDGDNWFGLHLANNGSGASYMWSSANRSGTADAAQVRLFVDYSFPIGAVIAPVPLPAGLPLMAAGICIFSATARRRR